MNVSTISKAIAGGLVSALVAIIYRYTGHQLDASVTGALGVLATAVTGYVVGHVAVYLAPANRG